MNLNIGQVTLIDLVGQIERKEVIINRDYQRGAGVWPASARTYFIDTLLEGYPFPKVYLYQVYNEKAQRPIKEIVDGQQRITTIIDFIKGKFKLTSSSKKYSGMTFDDLDENTQRSFKSYQVEVSIILSATRPELFEMFRRINAYTAPLSPAEKRHASYQGEFKWFVVENADEHSPLMENLGVFTSKQLARMADSEFIADLAANLENGVVEKKSQTIETLYKEYDGKFPSANEYSMKLGEFFSKLQNEFSPTHESFMMKSYAVNTLFCAYTHCRHGIPGGEALSGVTPNENRRFNFEKINEKLLELAHAHEEQDENGPNASYVKACLSSTTKLAQRQTRFKAVCAAMCTN
tara:strand:- start:1556 stop:2605 length:1050 start_codon:yes stop_codon:yes gene_type:complete